MNKILVVEASHLMMMMMMMMMMKRFSIFPKVWVWKNGS